MWKYANYFCKAKPVLELVMPGHLARASQPSSSSCNGHFAARIAGVPDLAQTPPPPLKGGLGEDC